MGIAEASLRASLTFLVLLILTRILGKKQISQLTFFNYITGITIGSMAANFTVDPEVSVTEGATGILVWAALTVLVGYISLKWSRARVALDGQPTILIRDGRILEKALAGCRLNMDDLSMLLREKDAFSVKDVSFAILEPDGSLSVMKKPDRAGVTREDLKLPRAEAGLLPTEIVVDGRIVYRNLAESNLGRNWLDRQLSKQGYELADVFYAELQSDGSLLVDPYDAGNS